VASAATEDASLYLELDGWEGPLDLLLDLARRQKVDLRRISILELVDQYLGYIERAEALKLELAADYLVMAAWLAYLKSLLLLPEEQEIQPSPRNWRCACNCACNGWARCARRGAADGARPAGARRVCARRAGRAAGRSGAALAM
jgi:segregation and condensation protein A